MKVLTEFFVLLTMIVTTGFSTMFCIIGLSTPGWHFDNYRSLFCDQCPKTPHACAIMSMILLITCLVFVVLLITGIIDEQRVILMRVIVPPLLLISSLFLLATFTSYLNFIDPNHGYSYNMTITAFVFAYLASLLGVFWLGTAGFISKTYAVEKLVEN